MNKKMTCKQVQAILPFYLKGRVNPTVSGMIEEHLQSCPTCKEIYIKAFEQEDAEFDFVDSLINSQNDDEQYVTKEYANFRKKLSAYLDSELEDSENIKIKKMTVTNPLARKDLQNMYNFKRLLHSSFDRTKENCHYDFSKNIIRLLNKENPQKVDNFFRAGIFFMIISVVTLLMIVVGV